MGTIPVGRTLGETLNFIFGRYPALFGAAWLPLLALGAVYYFAFVPFFEIIATAAREAAQNPHAQMPPPDMRAFQRVVPIAQLAVLVISPWLNVGIVKAALRVPRAFPAVYIGFGLDELRLIGANLVIMALTYAAMIPVIVAVVVIAGITAALAAGGMFHSSGGMWLGAILLCLGIGVLIAGVGAAIYALTRLMFFLAPVTILEQRFGLWRSWQLSKGHFWNMFGIMVAAFFVMLALEFVVMIIAAVPFIVAAVHAASTHQSFDAFMAALRSYLPFGAVVLLLVMPLLHGLQMAPSAFAYRFLMQSAKPAEPAA